MKQTLSTSQAAHLLITDEYASWSYSGALALCEYLEDNCQETDEYEFDKVAIRCEYLEYKSLTEFARQYGTPETFDIDEYNDSDEEIYEKIRRYINDYGTLIEFDGGIIVSNL